MKPLMNINVSCTNLGEIKELLPDIATLQKKYDVTLAISYSAGMDLPFLEEQLGNSRNTEKQSQN